jgi:hypothetical protein
MGWYSLWRWFSPWSKRKYVNMIYYYSEYVLKSQAQRDKEKKEKQKHARELLLLTMGIHALSEKNNL